MKKWTMLGLVASVLVLTIMLVTTQIGCFQPPMGTVIVKDEAGRDSSLAYDKNKDGIPDEIPVVQQKIDPVTGQPVVDATGKPVMEIVLGPDGKPLMKTDLVPGGSIYQKGEIADATGPTVLNVLSPFLPAGIGAILAGLAGAWKLSRFGRVFSNTVMSIQIARQRLKDGGYKEALALFDEAVDSGQLQLTTDEIRKIKEKMGLASVSDSSDVPKKT